VGGSGADGSKPCQTVIDAGCFSCAVGDGGLANTNIDVTLMNSDIASLLISVIVTYFPVDQPAYKTVGAAFGDALNTVSNACFVASTSFAKRGSTSMWYQSPASNLPICHVPRSQRQLRDCA